MKTLFSYRKFFILTLLLIPFISCEPDEINEEVNNSSFTGIWVRTIGASGDETDIAIGVIEGQANRIYMCEKRGSTAAGFYKGYLNGNTIVWDSNHNLPNTTLRMVGSQLEFHYSSVQGSLPTLYNRGSWSGECGSLTSSNTGGSNNNAGGENATTGDVTFWVQSDMGCGSLNVVINGTSGTISSYYPSGNPGCNSNGSANFRLPAGTYNYSASCANYTWNGTITITNGQCSTMQLYL